MNKDASPSMEESKVDGKSIKSGEWSESKDFRPLITANYNKKSAQAVIYIEFCAIIIVILYTNKYFYEFMFNGSPWLLVLTPLALYGLVWQFAGYALAINWLLYRFLLKIEPPKEGLFPIEGREFKHYTFRFWIAYFTIWMFRAMPLPWADMFAFRAFGAKIGQDTVLYDSWIDVELVEVGDHVMLSLNTGIFSHCIYRNEFLVQKVVIKKNGIVGAEALVAPGTIVEEGAVIGAGSTTHIGQRLEDYRIHVGTPCNKSFPIKIVEAKKKGENGESGGKNKLKNQDESIRGVLK